jgi:hypothetical protein
MVEVVIQDIFEEWSQANHHGQAKQLEACF